MAQQEEHDALQRRFVNVFENHLHDRYFTDNDINYLAIIDDMTKDYGARVREQQEVIENQERQTREQQEVIDNQAQQIQALNQEAFLEKIGLFVTIFSLVYCLVV